MGKRHGHRAGRRKNGLNRDLLYGAPNGVYHSLYDTIGWFQRFGDPDYEYGVAQADMVGRMLMRFANAEILPFDFADTADVVAQYLDELVELDAEGRSREALRAIAAANARLRVPRCRPTWCFRKSCPTVRNGRTTTQRRCERSTSSSCKRNASSSMNG